MNWFWIKSINADYQGATNEEIRNDCINFKNYLEHKVSFSFLISKRIDIETLINEKINLSSGFCKTILCLMANNSPFDFTNHKAINIYDVLVEYKKSELHHIFPQRSEIARNYPKEQINSILNICFLPKVSNGSISNDNPSLYFNKKVKEKNTQHYLSDLRSNLIPSDEDSAIWDDDFKKFLHQRASLMLSKISELV